MSLIALKLLSPQQSFSYNNSNIALTTATDLAFMHLFLAMNITRLRVKLKQQVKVDPSFLKWSRIQINHAEYSGVLIALLLFIHSKHSAPGKSLPPLAKWSTVLSWLGSLVFVYGYSQQTSIDSEPHPFRVIGALLRYIGLGGLAIQAFNSVNNP